METKHSAVIVVIAVDVDRIMKHKFSYPTTSSFLASSIGWSALHFVKRFFSLRLPAKANKEFRETYTQSIALMSN